jgi:hypothetical protein
MVVVIIPQTAAEVLEMEAWLQKTKPLEQEVLRLTLDFLGSHALAF